MEDQVEDQVEDREVNRMRCCLEMHSSWGAVEVRLEAEEEVHPLQRHRRSSEGHQLLLLLKPVSVPCSFPAILVSRPSLLSNDCVVVPADC